jgi:catechol 2,3-dioxygenase-like lactoylglutathione lyase family enzyme
VGSASDTTLENVSPVIGSRDLDAENDYGLQGMDHFALPSLNVTLMEKFVREVLGGKPYYYAGFDEVDREMGRVEHIFMRVGNVLFQCAAPGNGEMVISKDDPNVSPHWAFRATAQAVLDNARRLRALGIPVAGPYRHRNVDIVSIYFQTPEGHKLEICTWEPFPEEESVLMGAHGVGMIDWPSLAHDWH